MPSPGHGAGLSPIAPERIPSVISRPRPMSHHRRTMRIGTLPRLPAARIRARAERDHAAARGTLHLNRVREALENLEKEIERLDARLGALREKAIALDREFDAALRRAIVLRELQRVPGIGPALAREIVETCYDGILESLGEAGAAVQGIGERRQEAIRAWIGEMRSRLPALLAEPSPEREELTAAYAKKRERLEREKARTERKIAELEDLRRRAEEGTRWLRSVTPEHFVLAYRGDKEARELVERYLIGLFPEWEEPPDWFVELTGRFD